MWVVFPYPRCLVSPPAVGLSLLMLILTVALSSTLKHTEQAVTPPGGCDRGSWGRAVVEAGPRCVRGVASLPTHTLRAFCLQTSRAVTPTMMATRNMPALMPSITPLEGSAATTG